MFPHTMHDDAVLSAVRVARACSRSAEIVSTQMLMQPSQICTEGPVTSFRTSRWDLLQNEQRNSSGARSLVPQSFMSVGRLTGGASAASACERSELRESAARAC